MKFLTLEILVIVDRGISCKIALTWKLQDLTDDKSTLVQVMAWCRNMPKYEQTTKKSVCGYAEFCDTWVYSFNSLRPSDAIWPHRSGSTLAAPSHYLNQCLLIIRAFCGIHVRANSQDILINLIHTMCSHITLLKELPHLTETNELTSVLNWFPNLQWSLETWNSNNKITPPHWHQTLTPIRLAF